MEMIMLRIAGSALLVLFGVGPGTPASPPPPPIANGASLSAVARAYLHAEQRGDTAAMNALTTTDLRNCPALSSIPVFTAIVERQPFSLVTRRERARWRVEPMVRNIDGDTESGGSEIYVVRDAGQYRVCLPTGDDS
jgi:hypothetical protein